MGSMKLDFKKMKFLHSDGKSTTFQHPAGHKITIAHNAISPANAAALNKLAQSHQTQPQVQEQQWEQPKLAKGGEIDLGHKDKELYNKGVEQLKSKVKVEGPKHKAYKESVDKFMRTPGPGVHVTIENKPKFEEAKGGFIDLCKHYAAGGNVGEQRKKVFGSQSSPSNPKMREKHIEHILDFAKKLLHMEIQPSGGKINPKTGECRDENPEVGADKPDWRSGQIESQWNPDAIVHEIAHLLLMPPGIGLKKAQELMDKQYAQVQKEHGYMKQKRSQHEVQPMAVEQILRRHLGLPPNQNAVPVKEGEGPRTAVEDNSVIGTRVKKGNKEVDLIRQARNLTPENRKKVEAALSGKMKFHPDLGWQINPDAMGAKVQLYKEQQAAQQQAQQQGNQPPMMPQMAAADGGEVQSQQSQPQHQSDPNASEGEKAVAKEYHANEPATDASSAIHNIMNSWAKGGEIKELVHYSPKAGLKELSPEHMSSSGVRGAQYKRGVPENKSTFYYTKDSEPEELVTSHAKAKYTTKLGPKYQVYDLSQDQHKVMEHVRNNNGGAFNEDMLHEHLKSKGYHGVKWDMDNGTSVVQMYEPMKVEHEEAMARGGQVRKMYADPSDLVSQDDPAPINTNDIGGVQNIIPAGHQEVKFDDQSQPPQYNQYGQPTSPQTGGFGIDTEALQNYFNASPPPMNATSSGPQYQVPQQQPYQYIQPQAVAATQAEMNANQYQQAADQYQNIANQAINPGGQDQNKKQNQSGVSFSPQSALNQQVQGIQEEAQAQGELGKQQAAVLAHQADAQQQAMNAFQESYQELEKERQAHIEDIQNNHIDPEQYWEGTIDKDGNKVGGHSKLMSALGIILGGFNPTSSPNAALGFLNQQIDRNLDAQRQNLGAKQNLLAANLQQFGNLQNAFTATRVMLNDQVANSLNQQAALAQSPIQAARAKAMAGQIRLQNYPLMLQLGIQQSISKLQNGGGNPDAIGQLVSQASLWNLPQAQVLQGAYVPGIGLSKTMAQVPQEARNQIRDNQVLMNLMNQAVNFKMDHPGAQFSPQQRYIAESLMSEISNVIRTSGGMGVFKPSEMENIKSMIGTNPAGFMSWLKTDPKLRTMLGIKQNEYKALLNQYNLPVPQQPDPNEGQIMRSKSTGQRFIIKGGKPIPYNG